jgi:hypothetical protein
VISSTVSELAFAGERLPRSDLLRPSRLRRDARPSARADAGGHRALSGKPSSAARSSTADPCASGVTDRLAARRAGDPQHAGARPDEERSA